MNLSNDKTMFDEYVAWWINTNGGTDTGTKNDIYKSKTKLYHTLSKKTDKKDREIFLYETYLCFGDVHIAALKALAPKKEERIKILAEMYKKVGFGLNKL